MILVVLSRQSVFSFSWPLIILVSHCLGISLSWPLIVLASYCLSLLLSWPLSLSVSQHLIILVSQHPIVLPFQYLALLSSLAALVVSPALPTRGRRQVCAEVSSSRIDNPTITDLLVTTPSSWHYPASISQFDVVSDGPDHPVR
jgi:hypothetical protein